MFVSKRILFLIGVVVVIVMLGAGIGLAYAFNAFSQQRATNANLSATATAQVSASSTTITQKSPAQRRVVGVIQTLNAQSFTLVVTTKKVKRTFIINVSAQTTYGHAGKAATFSDLQVGETVIVLGSVNPKALTMQATRVMIAPKAAKPTVSPTPNSTATATATPA
jgi:hypothetical protein